MNFEEWEPYYREILAEFGFDRKEDDRAALRLDALLRTKRDVGRSGLAQRLRGKTVVVAGPAESLRLAELAEDHVVIAADGATTNCIGRAVLPGVIVTDLDGNLADLQWANDRGAIAVIHAHGDNQEALEAEVPEFAGPLSGTTQSSPFGALSNFGGFTDGDRACWMAAEVGAKALVLVGFDFDNPVPKPGANPAQKRRKLAWARRLIEKVAERVPVEFV